MRFSIIIPIYNTEIYLEECVKSILRQRFIDYEIILIDDGSPDNAGLIADKIAQNYRNIKVIHKPNEGVCSARNIGIKSAAGEYIIFLDSDDILHEDILEKANEAIINNENVDIIFAKFKRFTDGLSNVKEHKSIYDIDKINISNYEDILIQLFGEQKEFPFSVLSNIYRAQYIKDNNIYFDPKLIVNEDGNWLLEAIIKAKKYTAINHSVMYYREASNNSVTKASIDIKKMKSSFYVYTRWFDYFKNEYTGKKETQEVMLRRMAKGFFNLTLDILDMKQNEQDEFVGIFNQRRDILNYVSSSKHKIGVLVLRCVGIKNFIRIANLANKIRNRIKRN